MFLPVISEARLGTQTAACMPPWQWAPSNDTPAAASASRLGVRTSALPLAPMDS